MLIDVNADNRGIEDTTTTGYDQHRRGINMIMIIKITLLELPCCNYISS